MKVSTRLGKVTAVLLAVLLVLALGEPVSAHAQQAPQRSNDSQTAIQASSESSSQSAQTTRSDAANSELAEYPDAPTPQNTQSSPSAANQSNVPASNDQQEEQQSRPLGTAAAPETKPTGVTGSRPAGAVIAPAKQRRVHAILISVGLLAGAGIAIGTVAALSKGSPSRP